MLVLKRKEGQWVEIHHQSGDVIRLRVYGICSGVPGRVNIAFDDAPRKFEIRRPERASRPTENAVDQSASTVVAIDDVPSPYELPQPFDSAVPVVVHD